MAKDRVLFLSPIYPPMMGGASIHFSQLTSRLRGEVFDQAVVLTGFVSPRTVVERDEGNWIIRALFPPDVIGGSYRRPKLAFNYLVVALFVLFAVTVLRVSVAHTQTKRYYEWGTTLARKLGTTVVIEGQDLGSATFGARGDFFVAISQNVADAARHRDERIIQVPVGVDFEAFPAPDGKCQPTEDAYILYVGDVARRKGVDALLEAYRSLESDKRLVVVGEVLDDNLRSIMEGADGVQYEGVVPHDTAIHYMANAELTGLPSREEAIGRVPIESFYVGTPCVCPPDVPEYREHVPHLVLSSVTPEDIREKVEDLLSTEHVELSYPVERHGLDNTMQHYVSMYRTHIDPQ